MDTFVMLVLVISLTSTVKATISLDLSKMETETIAKYPGYFYTNEEVKILEQMLPVNQRMSHDRVNSSTESSKIGEGQEVYHGCCASAPSLTSYKTLEDGNGNIVTLAEFPDKKQYFSTETCNMVSPCSTCFCSCQMVTQLFTAVIVKPKNTKPGSTPSIDLSFVKVPTFCRCFNRPSGMRKESVQDKNKVHTSHDSEL